MGHKVDTIAKRLMSNQGKVGSHGPRQRELPCLTCVKGHLRIQIEHGYIQGVCRRHNRPEVHISLSRPWLRSRIQGLLYPVGTRAYGRIAALCSFSAQVLQRIYKYGGQPFVRDYLALHHGSKFDNTFGKGTGKAIMHATAGRYNIGVVRIVTGSTDLMH